MERKAQASDTVGACAPEKPVSPWCKQISEPNSLPSVCSGLGKCDDPARVSFNDPDGNTWLVQEVTTRLPGRI